MFRANSASKIKEFLYCPESFYQGSYKKRNQAKTQDKSFFKLGNMLHSLIETNGNVELDTVAFPKLAKQATAMYEAIKDDVEIYTTEPQSIREEMFKITLTKTELEKYNNSKYPMNKVDFWGAIDNYQVIDEDGRTFIRIVDWKTSKSIFVDDSLIRQPQIYAWLLWNVDKEFTDFEVMLYFAKLKANNQLPYSFPSSKIRKTPEFKTVNKDQLIEIDKFIKQTTADMIAYIKYREEGGEPKPLKKISKLCAYKDSCNDICETYLKANQ